MSLKEILDRLVIIFFDDVGINIYSWRLLEGEELFHVYLKQAIQHCEGINFVLKYVKMPSSHDH